MEFTRSIKSDICSLFEVYYDGNGVHRVVTPFEYLGSGDKIVVRVRNREHGFVIDDNGEAAFFATMADGDVESESIARWAEELKNTSPVHWTSEEEVAASTQDERLIATYVFRVAEAAQYLYALATSRPPRKLSEFKSKVASAVAGAANNIGFHYESDVTLPIAGDFVADHVIEASTPLIIVAATGIQRLLEAEIIHMRYQHERINAFVLAAVESQRVVGPKQFERANYYTGKTVTFNEIDFKSLIASRISTQH